ncbi:MAG: hypothetical protein RMI36_11430 [Thermus sp.]|uniref:hypothetical protein n=1 Tax=Thermus sp. TaxID=275 RepID=UPI00298F02AD|nr:hypothetical protein [Thermus sp.]MDW8018425.1 hypothetical protein [Thermus sp.]
MRQRFMASLASFRSDRRLLLLVLIPFLAEMALAPLGALVPAMILLDLGLTSREAGLASAAFTAGFLTATQLFARIRITPLESVGISAVVLGLGNLGTGLLAYPHFLLGSFLADGGTMAVGLLSRTFLQLLAPPSLVGQMLALHGALALSSRPLGLFLGAALGEPYGARLSVTLIGLFLFLVGLLGCLVWSAFWGAWP